MSDLISRRAAIDTVVDAMMSGADADMVEGLIYMLPSAQPDLDEWCTDCKEYDQERHCCPRWNRVIREALKDAQPEQQWIPIKWHDCTDEDRENYGFSNDIVAVFDCEMPNDDQPILVTTSHGYVNQDVCYIDDGFYLDSGYDWIDDITAWMPLPEPYAERREE